MSNTSKIAILATGDELVNGDILNTNAHNIANQLFAEGFSLGWQLTCDDSQQELELAMQLLLQQHDALIITGGLGPTSDDRTRFALASVLKQALVLHEPSWEAIVERLSRINLAIADSNRQQALFPENATIYPNPNGTAAGCGVRLNDKRIYLLPGPPRECLPMFAEHVKTDLLQHFPKHNRYYQKWRLYGVPEGQIAEQLDSLLKPFTCQTGYRIDFPYIEFKLHIDAPEDTQKILALLDPVLQPHIICTAEKTAVEMLQETIAKQSFQILIDDRISGGLLQTKLLSPKNTQHLHFEKFGLKDFPQALKIQLTGLNGYWQDQTPSGTTNIAIKFFWQKEEVVFEKTLPFRNNFVLLFATEWCAYQINEFILSMTTSID